MIFPNLSIKQEYRSPQDNIIKDFYIRVLENAVSYRRSVGFFSSSALVEISKGICELAKKGGKIELVASPYLSAEDEEAIRKGYESRAKIIENALLRGLKTEPENFFEKERLNLLANLVESGVLNIKIAFTENGSSVGMYHEKLGLVEDSGGNKIAFSGSMNESDNAFTKNYETVDVFCSWKSTDEKARVIQKETAFAAIWGNFDEKLKVLHFPSIDKAILEKYKRGTADFELDKKEFSKDRNIMYKISHGDKTVIPDVVAVAEADSVDAVFEDKLFFDFKGKKSPLFKNFGQIVFDIVAFQHREHLFKPVAERPNRVRQNVVAHQPVFQIFLEMRRIFGIQQQHFAKSPLVSVTDALPNQFRMRGISYPFTERG